MTEATPLDHTFAAPIGVDVKGEVDKLRKRLGKDIGDTVTVHSNDA